MSPDSTSGPPDSGGARASASPEQSALIDTYRRRLSALRDLGRSLREAAASVDDARVRGWQQECAALVSQLSGGDKTHWLSRAFSQAFLVTAATPSAPTADARPEVAGQVPLDVILERLDTVLAQAEASLARLEAEGDPGPGSRAPSGTRFAFVEDAALRTGLEQADAESERALERGEFAVALVAACSVLESVVTDAIDRRAGGDARAHGGPDAPLGEWPFDARIAVAEKCGWISAGCRRLPAVARRYRELLTADGDVRRGVSVTVEDARRTRQVLRVILRDLTPGR